MPITIWILAVVASCVILLLGLASWFDRVFEEPGVPTVPSLASHTGSRSVLAVFAHPDDETLVAGALAEASSREGHHVHSVTLTRGEKGYARPPICHEDDLGIVRESELRRYGYFLGLERQELWEYPDGALGDVPQAQVVDRLVTAIRRSRPDLVIGFDPAGGYTGHPDHKAAGHLTTLAVRLGADPSYHPELGAPHRPNALAYVVAPRRMLELFGDQAMRDAAAVQPAPHLSIPAPARVKAMGSRLHQSQHLDRAYGLPARLLYDFFDKEHYVLIDPASLAPDHRG